MQICYLETQIFKVTLIQYLIFIQTIILVETDISMFKVYWISIEILMKPTAHMGEDCDTELLICS